MTARKTLIIPQPVVRACLDLPSAVVAVEAAFAEYGRGHAQMPAKVYLTFEAGDYRSMPAWLPGLGLAGVKNVNVHPDNRHLPSVMALYLLIDPVDGFPLAIMDATYITQLRTAAATAIATRHLARAEARTAGIIGCGEQARHQLDALCLARPSLDTLLVFDLDPQRAQRLAHYAEETHGLRARVAESAGDAVRASDVLVTTTPSRKPIVRDADVRPGLHINAIGADATGKQELETGILRRARIVIDNWEQSSHSGEINVAVATGMLGRQDITAEMGQIVLGERRGRTGEDQITIFDSTGVAIQDLACAAVVYQRTTDANHDGVSRVDLLGLA